MKSARFAIDNDNTFYLEHLPPLNGLLKKGITVFVDKDFPKYNDMTLIQYAIAKRKPKTLELMLKRAKELGISEQDIIYPKSSNTKSSLLKLAVEFGSINFYDTVDNTCLKVIINNFTDSTSKHSIFKDNICTKVPLIQSIRYGNKKAAKNLIKAGANLLYPIKKGDKKFNSFDLFDMPIMTLFKLYNEQKQLEEVFNYITKSKGNDIIFQILELNDESGRTFISSMPPQLLEARTFLENYKERDEGIKHFDDEKQTGGEGQIDDEKHTGGEGQIDDEENNYKNTKICPNCGKKYEKYNPSAKKWICSNCDGQ